MYTNGKGAASVFDALREAVPIERLVETNGHRKALCVAHEEQTPSMHIYEDHVHCFACGFHGDVTDVWGAQRGIERPFEAALDLAREFGVQLPEMSKESRQRAEEQRAKEESHLKLARRCHHALDEHPGVREWWEGRGFGAELRERFLLGTNRDGTEGVIPFWNRGRVLGLVRRKLEGEPKYKLPTGEKDLFIPGPIKQEIFLTESYPDALAVVAAGRNAIAVGGTDISDAQTEELRNLPAERFYILPHADEPGAEAAKVWGRRFFPRAKVCPADYTSETHKDIADLFAASGSDGTTEHLNRLVVGAKDLIDLETEDAADLPGGPRERLAYATEHIVPLLARISPPGMQDATADIVADSVEGLKKSWLNKAIKDESERLEGEMMKGLIREAEEAEERRRAEHQARVEKAQPEIDELLAPGVLTRLRDAAAKVHHVERDERALEAVILIALGAQLAPLPNGRPSGASALLTAEPGRGKNHLADAAVELLPEEFYEAFEIVSAQAFYYGVENDPDFLKHTFVYPNEIEGVEALVEFLRPMLSKGWCKKHVTDKDPITGRNVMRTMVVEGPVTTIIPTVRNKTDDQLQTRLLMAELEDYLGRVKLHSMTVSDLYHPDHAAESFERERFLWAEGLRQLTATRRVTFRIEHPDFAYDDDQVSHGARLWANLLGLMSAHAWLEQKNRRILDLGEEGGLAIEARPDDYEAAYNVFTQVCERTTVNLSETHRKILDGLHELKQKNPGRYGFTQREIGAAGGISFQAVSKHKTYLISSAKLLTEGDQGLDLLPGVAQEEWRSGDITKGLPSPDKVREWWEQTPPTSPDGERGQTCGQRGQPSENGHKADTYAENSVHTARGQAVDTSTHPDDRMGWDAGARMWILDPLRVLSRKRPDDDRGHVHTLSTEAVDGENGIGKPNADREEDLSTLSTPSQDTPLLEDEEEVFGLFRDLKGTNE